MLKRLLNDNKTLIGAIVTILCLSCAYHYVSYVEQAKRVQHDIESVQSRIQTIEWKNVESVITDINREGDLQANIAALMLKDAIVKNYNNINELKAEFDSGNYNSLKFNHLLIETIPKTNVLNNFNERNGVFVATDKKIIYNLMVDPRTIDNTWDEFIEANYNQPLAKANVDMLQKRYEGLKFIEPAQPQIFSLSTHTMISMPSMEQLKDVYIKEGLNGLYGYVILNAVFITSSGDIFNTPDYNDYGEKANNHKIMVVSCISLYDVIINYHQDSFGNLHRILMDSLEAKKHELNEVYYSSIYLVLIHLIVIISIIGFAKYVRTNDID